MGADPKKGSNGGAVASRDIRNFFGGGGKKAAAKREAAAPSFDTADFLRGYRAVWNHSKIKKGYSGTVVFLKKANAAVAGATVTCDGLDINDAAESPGPGDEDRLNGEGRLITVELPEYFICHTYVPNSGQKLEKLPYRTQVWDKCMASHMARLAAQKPVIWTGDLNVVRGENDIHDGMKKTRNKAAGCADAERENFGRVVGGISQEDLPTQLRGKNPPQHGQAVPGPVVTRGPDGELDPSGDEPLYVDAYRHFHPYATANAEADENSSTVKNSASSDGKASDFADDEDENAVNPPKLEQSRFTYWSNRQGARTAMNGWRLDYWVVHHTLINRVDRVFHRPTVFGSDHVPIGLVMKTGDGE
mmetsp:Transcript_21093/g.64248  ORF Transcript_21093/g.64248 Transcript_21093/m.64248 type:complete len:361 (-) Transcript_21093:1343-2425(-)